MNKMWKFFKKQKSKVMLRPYTFYPDSKIRYVTKFENGFAPALIAKQYSTYSPEVLEVSIIDSEFNIATSTQYICDSKCRNGYFIATNSNYPKNSNKVFLDKELKEVPDKVFCSISVHNNYFITGKAISNDPNMGWPRCWYGLLDSDLNEILPATQYSEIKPISPTRFCCSIEDKPVIVFDALTKKTFPLEGVFRLYDEIENGYYKFISTDENRLYGYFDHNFEIAIEPKYASLGYLDKNGFAPFARDNVIGVVNTTGKEFIR